MSSNPRSCRASVKAESTSSKAVKEENAFSNSNKAKSEEKEKTVEIDLDATDQNQSVLSLLARTRTMIPMRLVALKLQGSPKKKSSGSLQSLKERPAKRSGRPQGARGKGVARTWTTTTSGHTHPPRKESTSQSDWHKGGKEKGKRKAAFGTLCSHGTRTKRMTH